MSVWIEQFMAWGDSHPSFALLCVWIMRAAVIVVTAWIIQRLARSRSSSVRHCVWIGAFGALVLLIPQLLTAIPIRIPVQVQSSTSNETRVPSDSAGNSSERSLAMAAPVDRSWNATDANASGFERATPTAASPAPAIPTSDVVASASTRQRSDVIVPNESSIALIVSVIYGVGFLSWLARIVVSGLRLRRFARHSIPFSREHRALAQFCAARLGLRSPPQCRVSTDVSMPLTFGVIRPIVLVPIDFQSFTVDQQRHCLLHEMAHVARRDACWNWLAEITTAVYWFHPAVHWARWQLRRSREDAADDAVVRSGERASAYSRSLLEITQNIVASASQPVAAVHSGTNLQNRIGRLLDPRLNVDPQSSWTVAVVGVVFSLITLTGIHFQIVTGQTPPTAETPRPQRSNPEQSANVSADIAADGAATTDERSTDVGLYDQFKAVELATSDDDDQERIDIEFQGRVTDPSGPIADAVVLIREFVAFRGPSGRYLSPPIVARTTTDQQGRYHIRGVPTVRLKSLGLARWEVLVADPSNRLGLGAYALSSFDRRQPTPWKASIDIQLPGSEELAAQVVTPAGSGIGDVRVAVKEINVPESVDSDAGPFFRGSKQGFPKQSHVYRFPTDVLQLLTRTDSDGQFAFQMPKNASLVLGLRQSDSFPRLLRLSAPGYQTGLMATRVADEYASPATIELRRLLFISVAAEDEAGEAVKQFSLSVLAPRGKTQSQRFQVSDDGELRTTKEFLREAAGDDGRVQFVARFPFESGLLPLATSAEAESVIDRRSLRLQTRQGTRASGRVIRASDGEGVGDVQVCWHRQADHLEDTLLRATTDAQGEWRMVVPKGKGYLTVVGSSPGLDLWMSDRFNAEASRPPQMTQAIEAGDLDDLEVPDFQIQSIPVRWVTVVDTSGSPVEGVWVHCGFVETLNRDNRTYHLPQTLAESAMTGPDGRCALLLHRSSWEHGTVSVTKIDDESSSTRPRFTAAQATITPGSDAPIKLVLRDPWLVSGRVMLDGTPATGLTVGLTTRLIGSGDFGQFKTDTVPIGEDGSFQVQAVAGLEYAVAVRQDAETEKKYFYWQTPIPEARSGRVDVGTLSISSNQLKTHQQLYDERYKPK
ncbi:MAG: hypothetical protein F9B45_09380 [Phycisphaera sp. RhM]|nr:hypothetical protein [Phycisphaera sp. RhM]